jgi:hypothetical protein
MMHLKIGAVPVSPAMAPQVTVFVDNLKCDGSGSLNGLSYGARSHPMVVELCAASCTYTHPLRIQAISYL